MNPHRRFARTLLSLTLLAVPAGLSGQELDDLRDRWKVELPPAQPVITMVGGISPGTNTGSQSAFGVSWGHGFAGLGYQERARFTDKDDATLAVGFGLGDPRKYAGLEVAFTSSSTLRSTPYEEGFLSLKLHRLISNDMAIAVGVESIAEWDLQDDGRRSGGDSEESWYGVVSKTWGMGGFLPFNKVTTSLGFGNGRFHGVDEDVPVESEVFEDEKGWGPFGAIALQVVDEVSLIADWTGQDLGIGASIAPFQSFPLIVTPAVMDVTETAGDGARFIVGIGVGFEWANLFKP